MARRKVAEPVGIENVSKLWEYLTPEQRAYLSRNYTIRHYRKNEIIYSEGETAQNVLCLANGKVKILRDGIGGRSQIVRIIKAVEYFGYRAVLAEEPYVTSAVAMENSTIYVVSGGVFVSFLKQNTEVAYYFVKALAVDLGIADSRSANLTQKHIRGRLAESLLFLKDTYGYESDDATISVYLSREDLASLSNMTTSNAIRTLTVFANEKIITVDGRKIKIIDEDRLKKINNFG
ncbi:MAG: Crp/Fnr family transcriptional regulator [Prevotellaceae bacterium]|jgi:CRP-like cAMP-binding protein|nr:Crp/Fnr family transcriptional regulator [Prevotellaceae bacterium]